jgi:hypothetical protein
MAGSWGAILATMRLRSGEILAPHLAHVAADVTIVALSYALLR